MTTTAQTLTPGRSTIADAAAAHGVTVHAVMVVLADCLTDVYTPAGDGAVIAEHGTQYATVNGEAGSARYAAADLTLGSDSIGVLFDYL